MLECASCYGMYHVCLFVCFLLGIGVYTPIATYEIGGCTTTTTAGPVIVRGSHNMNLEQKIKKLC